MTDRRTWLRGCTLLPMLSLGACAAGRPPAPPNRAQNGPQSGPQNGHCFRLREPGRATCAPQPALPAALEQEVKRLAPAPDLLSVYVVRQRWADGQHLITLQAAGQQVVLTPDSFVRLRLPPGEHRLAFDWQGEQRVLQLRGAAGESRFVALAGSAWVWGSDYRWVGDAEDDTRSRIARCRLLADLQLPR